MVGKNQVIWEILAVSVMQLFWVALPIYHKMAVLSNMFFFKLLFMREISERTYNCHLYLILYTAFLIFHDYVCICITTSTSSSLVFTACVSFALRHSFLGHIVIQGFFWDYSKTSAEHQEGPKGSRCIWVLVNTIIKTNWVPLQQLPLMHWQVKLRRGESHMAEGELAEQRRVLPILLRLPIIV